MRNRLFPLLSLLLVAMISSGCQKEAPAEESCNFQLNSKHRRVSWFRLPVQYYVDESVSWEMVEVIKEAMSVWNKEFDKEVFELVGRTEGLPGLTGEGVPPQDAYNGIYYVPDGKSFKSTEQARTHLYHRGDFIHEADISINGTLKFYLDYKNSIRESAINSTKIDFLSLMIHEFGHVLGLGHIKSKESTVMKSTLDPGVLRSTISEIDKASLACEY